MSCRSYPPFYEVEQNGQCVKNPPKTTPDTAKDYILLGLFAVGMFAVISYAINK